MKDVLVSTQWEATSEWLERSWHAELHTVGYVFTRVLVVAMQIPALVLLDRPTLLHLW